MSKNNNLHSFVYKNIFIYRIILNLLYLGKYHSRYTTIIKEINNEKDYRILELCFGDIIIANWCKFNKKKWVGIDINSNFINLAIKNKLVVHQSFIDHKIELPKSDVVIISGSLYHFNENIDKFLNNIFKFSSKIIILEPIINLSSIKLFAFLFRNSSNISSKPHYFRYDKESILEILKNFKNKKYSVKTAYPNWKDMLITINKNDEI